MDDIARELGISKKTIYQYYKDKDEIVCIIAREHMDKEQEILDNIQSGAKDPIDELVQISILIRKTFHTMNPSLLFELKRYHPNAMKIFSDYMDKCVLSSVKENIEKGKKLGLYRPEVDTEIISKLRVQEAELAFNIDVFPTNQFNLWDIQVQFFDHYLYGIVSESGYKLVKKYFEKLNNGTNEKAA